MNTHENQYFGIWLDDNKALIITLDMGKTLIIPVFKSLNKIQDKGIKINETSKPINDIQYYNDIFSVLPKSETLLILGPDQNKLHFKEFLERESDKIKNIITKVAGHMTTSDVIATVRSYFLGETVEAV